MDGPTGDQTKTCPGCGRRGPATKEVCGRCGTDLIDVEPDPEVSVTKMPFRRPYRRERPTLHAVPLPPPSRRLTPLPPVPAEEGKRRRQVWWAAIVVILLVVGSVATLIGAGERGERSAQRKAMSRRIARAKSTLTNMAVGSAPRRTASGRRQRAKHNSRVAPKGHTSHSALLPVAARTPAESLAVLDGRPHDVPLYQQKLTRVSRRLGESEQRVATSVTDAHVRDGRPCMRFLEAYEAFDR
jgi:hypothetical protein